jgi:hypothetical protein
MIPMIRLETLISIFNLRRPHVENRLSWKLDKERMFTLQISIDGQSKAMLPSDEAQIYMNICQLLSLLSGSFCNRH